MSTGAVLLSWVLAASPAAVEALPTGVRWAAPEGCPPREAFVGALRFRTARAAVVDEAAAPTAWLDATLERVGRRFRGRLRLALPTGVTTREVASPNCASVVEALSLMAALVIDPEHARLGPLPATLPPPEPPPAPAPVVTPARPVPPLVIEPLPAPVAALAGVARPAPRRASPAWRLGANAHATTAISGALDVGGGAVVSLEAGAFVAAVQLGAGSGRTVASANGDALYPFHLLGSVSAGGTWRAAPWRVSVVASAQALAFSVSAPQAAEPIVAWRWLPSLGPAVEVGWSLGALEVALGLLGGAHLRRDTYLVDPQGGVFTTPAFFLQPSLSASARF